MEEKKLKIHKDRDKEERDKAILGIELGIKKERKNINFNINKGILNRMQYREGRAFVYLHTLHVRKNRYSISHYRDI